MSKTKSVAFVGAVGVATVLGLALLFNQTQVLATDNHQGHMEQMGHMKHMANMQHMTQPKAKTGVLTLDNIHFKHIPMVSLLIDKALKALESGDTKTASAQLNKAKKMLAEINKSIATYVKPKFANVRCPILNSPIEPDKVTKDLVRDYKGQKVAFCCNGCPAVWDKLTDSEKNSKLAPVLPAKKRPPHEH